MGFGHAFSNDYPAGSPGVIHEVGKDLFFTRSQFYGKFYRAAVDLFVRLRFLRYLPVRPAVKVFYHAHFYALFLMIAQFYLERLVQRVISAIETILHLPPLPHYIESVACKYPDRFIGGRMVDIILSDKLELAIIVLFIEAQPAFWKRDPEAIRFRIGDGPHKPDLGVRLSAVLPHRTDILS